MFGIRLPLRAPSPGRGRRFHAMAACAGLVLAAVATSGAVRQPPGRPNELSAAADAGEHSLAPGGSHEWPVALAPAEYLQVAVTPIGVGETDQWPMVAVVAPGGGVVSESAEPHIAPGVDSRARVVVSFVAGDPGTYRLRVAARATPVRYRLQLEQRRPAVAEDRQRIAAHGLWREGMRLFTQGSPDALRESVGKLNEALALLDGIGDSEGQAVTLGAIANHWYRLSDAAQGSAAASRALEIWTRLGREREEGVALSDLGLLAYLGYDHAAARRYYDQALAKHRAAGDVPSEARTLTRVGWVHYAAADLQQVLDVNHEALARYREARDGTGESIAFNDLGRAYLDMGEVSQALDAFQQALALRPQDRDARGAANVLIRTALVYLSVGEWQRALDALQQARTLAARAHDVRTEASALINLGSAYVTLGDTVEGFRYLDPGLTLAKSIDFRGAQAYALLWLGIGASLDGEPARSRDYLQQALAIQTAIKDVRGQATTLRQLAAVQLELGSARDALDSINRSIEISPRASGLIYTGDLTLANVHAALGDASKAQGHYEEAIGRFREVRARHAEALALTRFARFQAGRGLYVEARDLLEQALAIHETLRGLIVDPDLRMSYTSTALEPYRRYVDVLMELERRSPGGGFAAAAFHINERARARGLLDMLVASGVDVSQGVDPALVQQERSLRWRLNAKAAIQTRLLAGMRDERRLAALEEEIAVLSRDWRDTTSQVRRQSPAYAALAEPQPLTAADAGSLLDAGTVLLEFAPGETGAWLFAVTATSFESFALPPRRTIDETARAVHRLLTARQPVKGESTTARQARIRRADAELPERSRALSDLVLGPIGAKLAGAWQGRRLAIVAAGALEYVPFAALPLPGRSTPLAAAHEIVTLPSASTLAFLRQERSRRSMASRGIAVFADPVFTPDDPRVGRARRGRAMTTGADRAKATIAPAPLPDPVRGSLARLPFTRAEAQAVATQAPRGLLQATDFDATLTLAISGRLQDYRIVHFATHGLIDTRRPELSGLALSLVDARGRSRDGFLRLNTIYSLRLSADLVVLSACQTALGREVAGEGLVGLTRGFIHAGAKGVIATLWQVNDVATAELMKRFYAGMLQKNLPPAAALRNAQREIARDPRWASPYYWAGFVLQGDWK
jgi:CHAT domain-containing protein/Tfp pilus assembly protein PilF